jgi:hypothetical protein
MAARLQRLLCFAGNTPQSVTISFSFALVTIVLAPGLGSASFVEIPPEVFAQRPIQEYEAEDALRSRRFQVATNHSDFSGSGFVDYVGEGYVEWTVEVAEAGTYVLSFRYALKHGDRPLDIKVNGAVVSSSVSFPATGSWNSWGLVNRDVVLKSGVNTVRAQTVGRSGANMDRLDVTVSATSTQ